MDPNELLALVGLAIADSINTSTLSVLIVILIAARRPTGTGWSFTVGAILTFYLFALALFFGLSSIGGGTNELTLWIQRFLFAVLSIFLGYLGYRRLKDRPRSGVPALPTWINPYTGSMFGALMTAADLPNAFPLFFAIERLVAAQVSGGEAAIILSGYTLIYALPTVAILIGGLVYRDRIVSRLERMLHRFTTGVSRANWMWASVCFAAAAGCAYVATALG